MIIVNAIIVNAARGDRRHALRRGSVGNTRAERKRHHKRRGRLAAPDRRRGRDARPRDGAKTSGQEAAAAAASSQNGSAASELKTFLETADLGRYADALVAAGCASVARLKAMPQEELKNLKDPRTGGRVLAVGALARLRRQLNASPAPPPAPPPSGATPEPALTRHLAELGLDRFAPALARAGVSTRGKPTRRRPEGPAESSWIPRRIKRCWPWGPIPS